MKAAGETTLAILAGGEGSRMGRPKALLEIKGRPILRHILEQARWQGPTLLVTSPGRESPPGAESFDAEVSDPVSGLGPLRGLLTALEHAKTQQVVVAAVDMPMVGSTVFNWLTAQMDSRPFAMALILKRTVGEQTRIEPFPAAFRKSAIRMLLERLNSGKGALKSIGDCSGVELLVAPASWGPEVWTNLNIPKDIQTMGLS
jgi:molybdopterin-guanine dinucleotide biosynthesis protein A